MPIEITAREYAFGRFRVDAARRTLSVDGQQATLGTRAFDLLLALIERRRESVAAPGNRRYGLRPEQLWPMRMRMQTRAPASYGSSWLD